MAEGFKAIHPSCCRLGLVLAFIAMALCAFASRVTAQMAPLVPDPITTPELMRYADLLGLSDQQKIGLLPAHDAYKERYRQFHERDVTKLRDGLIDIGLRFQRNRFDIPPRDELEGLITQYARLLTTGQSIDRSLFDTIAANLTEEQLLQLNRAKTAREQSVYREIVVRMAGEMNQGARVDFSQLLRNLKLPPDQVAAADPILAEYESALLTRSKDVFQAMLKGFEVVLDTIDRLGLRGMSPEKMMELVQDQATIVSLQATFDEASKPFQSAAHEIGELNHRTYKKLAVALDADAARRVRERYYERAFREAFSGAAEWPQYFRAAMSLAEVSTQQRDELKAQLEEFTRQEDAMIDAVVTELQKWREYRSFLQFSQDRSAPVYEKTKELKQRRESLASNAIATVQGILGEQYSSRLEQIVAEQKQKDATSQPPAPGGATVTVQVDSNDERDGSRSGQVTVSATATPDGTYVPEPMSQADLRLLSQALVLNDVDQSVLSAMYDEYRAAFDALRASPLPTPESGEKQTASDEAKSQKSRYEELLTLDENFFADMVVVASSPAQQQTLEWIRCARQRAASGKTARSIAFIWGHDESFADPVLVLLQSHVSESTQQLVQAHVEAYQREVALVVAQRLEQARESSRMMARMRGNPGSEQSAKAQEFAREKYTDAQRELRKINREIARINRRLFEEVQRQLSESEAWAYRHAYYQEAYPHVYRDERSADRALELAQSLEDLSPQQRQAVADINSGHRLAYLDMCDKMIAMHRDRPEREDDFSKETVDRYMELERLRFERNELNARTRMRLRLTIGSDLAQRFPEFAVDTTGN